MDIQPIARIRSDFEGRFGTPRQPGLVPAARAALLLAPPYDQAAALRGLETCTHCWLVFGFHAIPARDWRPTVRPPRLGGNRRLGVFATRSPFRPNRLGLSLTSLEGLLDPPGRGLALRGTDLLDGTPVFDIKPYLPAIESRPDAHPPAGLDASPAGLAIEWTAEARRALAAGPPRLEALIAQTVAADPRPAYQHGRADRHYGMRLLGHEVRWQVQERTARILEVRAVPGMTDTAP